MTELTNDQREALGRLADLILDACAEAWGMIAPRGRMKSKQAIITALEYFTEPAWRELSQQREGITELRRYFDLRRYADQRAIACWQEAHPGKESVWPDHADLCVWLLAERWRLLEEVAELMRRAEEYRDAITYAARLLSPLWVQSNGRWRLIETDCGAMIPRGEGQTPSDAVLDAWRRKAEEEQKPKPEVGPNSGRSA